MIRPLCVIRPAAKRLMSSSASSNGDEYLRVMRLQNMIRTDASTCQKQLELGRFLVMHKGKPLINDDRAIAWADFKEAKAVNPSLEKEFVFLRMDENTVQPLFTLPVSDDSSVAALATGGRHFSDLRLAMFTVDDAESGGLLRHAWSLLRWHHKTNFCANCGADVERSFSGNQISCPSCSSVFYPVPSPVGIVLVESLDQSSVLLIRQPRYPKGMYSCIAGFVDMGESLESCVRREVAEEAGIDAEDVTVIASQHWPFPSGSLMFGCFARADLHARKPVACPAELEDARWFSPDELRDAFFAGQKGMRPSKGDSGFFVPPKQAIAHHLIKKWLTDHKHI